MTTTYPITSHKLSEKLYLNRAEKRHGHAFVPAPPKRVHHVVVIDCSGSMSGDMPRLRDQLKSKLRTLVGEDDTLSVVWFSAKGQAGIVFEGQRVRNMADLAAVEKTIDRWIRPVGLTGFVEPLQLASEIALRLEKESAEADASGKFKRSTTDSSLFFMSDGMDNQWSREKVLEAAKTAGQVFDATAFVEYGYYADRALLSEMAAHAGGSLIFAEGLEAYQPAFEASLKKIPQAERRLFAVPDGALGGIAFARSGSDLLAFAVTPEKGTPVPAHLDRVYWLSESPAGTPSGESVRSHEWAEPMYAALSLFSTRAEAAVVRGILRALADVRFIDMFSGCFGKQRYSAFMQAALDAAISPAGRWAKGIDEHHLPLANAYTVLDLLRLLAADDEARILFDYPSFTYAKIGRSRIDTSQALTVEEQNEIGHLQAKIAATKNGKLIAEFSQRIAQIAERPAPLKFVPDETPDGVPINGLVYNEETPNVSVRVRREGHVNISAPQRALNVSGIGITEKFETFQYRTYAIIKDGLLNVDVLPMRVSNETMERLFLLHKEGRIPDGLVKAEYKGVGAAASAPTVMLQLSLLPIVNDEMVGNVSAKAMFESEFQLLAAQASQKVFRSALAELEPTKQSKTFVQAYGQAGADFLRDLGFTDYGGFNPSTRLEEARDYYLAKELKIQIKGFSSLPSYAKLKEQIEAGKLSAPARLMKGAYEKIETAKKRLAKHPDRLADWIKAEERMIDADRRQLLEEKAQRVFALIVGQGWFSECPDALEPATMALTLTAPDGGVFAGLVCTATMGERKVEV